MSERIEEEIAQARQKYPNLQQGENLDWILIPDYPLPGGIYNRSTTRVLAILPPTYPLTPPDNFYVDAGLRLVDGSMPGSYSEGASVPIQGNWGVFSWHMDNNGWLAGVTSQSGDNLTTFLRSVGSRLREGA